jgi:hypothetical protein
MSLFKSQLFTEESPRLVLDLDQPTNAFGPTYGNHIANEKQFREAWDGNCQDRPLQPIDAP